MRQTQLAAELGYSQSAIGRWETGKRVPDVEKILKFAEFFNVSVDYLIGNDEDSFSEVLMLARQATGTEEEKEELMEQIKDTIDAFLESKGR